MPVCPYKDANASFLGELLLLNNMFIGKNKALGGEANSAKVKDGAPIKFK